MASLFECEVRYKIENIKEFEGKIKKMGAKLLYPYEFTDYYYGPKDKNWDLVRENLRIREWKEPKNPTTIYFVKNEVVSIGNVRFKRALYPQGKVPLFSGKLKVCKSLIDDLGFKKLFTVKKEKATFWELPQGFKTVLEYIRGIGWWGELEFKGENPAFAKKEIERALKILGIKKENVSYKTVSAIFSEKIKR
ncbi:MAG: CYTH domain-containing protein [Candidatus Pacebacteria bacterium]|nr:CYTH domain-containing protein [Candidatus Paceibacterota bacterium]